MVILYLDGISNLLQIRFINLNQNREILYFIISSKKQGEELYNITRVRQIYFDTFISENIKWDCKYHSMHVLLFLLKKRR